MDPNILSKYNVKHSCIKYIYHLPKIGKFKNNLTKITQSMYFDLQYRYNNNTSNILCFKSRHYKSLLNLSYLYKGNTYNIGLHISHKIIFDVYYLDMMLSVISVITNILDHKIKRFYDIEIYIPPRVVLMIKFNYRIYYHLKAICKHESIMVADVKCETYLYFNKYDVFCVTPILLKMAINNKQTLFQYLPFEIFKYIIELM